MADTQNYRKAELDNVRGEGGQIRVKFRNSEGETKWLSIAYEEFLALSETLTEG